MRKLNAYPTDDPESDFLRHRSLCHPRMRWDDHVHLFRYNVWPRLRERHYFDILLYRVLLSYEDEYIFHIANL